MCKKNAEEQKWKDIYQNLKMNQIKDNFIPYSGKIYFLRFPQWLGNTLVIKIKERSLKLKNILSLSERVYPLPPQCGAISSSTFLSLSKFHFIVLNNNFLGRLGNNMRNKN